MHTCHDLFSMFKQFNISLSITPMLLQRTIQSVLDCMIETMEDFDRVKVFYNVLECDESGRSPKDKGFDSRSKSPLQLIAKEGNKVKLNFIHKYISI